ncbi:HlyD family type I secretion periplasmic adaptor subunit [Teichococcus aestuarii]|uniref:HlyD family type I secretion periplasmic adaptor subunit n=1 Tax=Teichococcus aestuarii TaxID=568898 RepID=UPI003620C537
MNALSPAPPPSPLPASDEAQLVYPLLVHEKVPQRMLRRICVLVALSVLAFVGWAATARVHDVSQASGTIVPSGFERVVQHFEGGMVEQILVQPGELVERGAPIFILTDGGTTEDVQVMTLQRHNLLAQIEGLVALMEDRAPDFQAFGEDVAVRATAAAHAAQRDAQASQISLLDSQIEQARLQLRTLETQIAGLRNNHAFAAEQEARIGTLFNQGYATRTQYSERRKEREDAENQLQVALEKRRTALEAVAEAQKNKIATLASVRSDLASRIQELRRAVMALEGDVSKRLRRQERLTVGSPVRGIVKSLEVTTIGGVAGAGQPLAVIVPLDEMLHAETRLPVSQIGHVRPGLPVHVKISAYDFTRFGWIEGRVSRVSPSSFSGDGMAYYKVQVDLASNHLPLAPGALLSPGMAVTADIITGDKTVMAYLLSPIRRALSTSFQER